MRTSSFWIMAAANAFWAFGLLIPMLHIVRHAIEIGISPMSAAWILAIIGGSSVVGRIVMGSASDRIGRKSSLLMCLALNALVMFWLLWASNLEMLYIFAVIFGFAYGGCVPQWGAMVGEFFGLRAMGTTLGVVMFFATIGGAIGPLLGGHIFDLTDSYRYAFLMGGISIAIAVMLTLFLRAPKRKWIGV